MASANVEGGKFGYVFEQIDIVPVIAKLISKSEPVSDNHGVALRLRNGRRHLSDIRNLGDALRLALFDLMSNAIDYTPKDGTAAKLCRAAGKTGLRSR